MHMTNVTDDRTDFSRAVLGELRHKDSIPDLNEVLGFDFGAGMTMSHEVLRYAAALAEASPRVSLQVRGKSWEGRDMALLMVTSADNQKRLDSLQQSYRAIADPRITDRATFDALAADLPVLVWFFESVHGDEPSGTDAGLFTAYHLAASEDPAVKAMLDQVVVAFELMQNPDGRDRFIQYSRQNRVPGGDAHPRAAERDQPWPAGRLNHYLFDLNRDWFALTQVETRVKIEAYLDWFPHITIDRHEMSGESSFFAAQPAAPINPVLPKSMSDAYADLGQAIAKEFDSRRIDYFHGEVFDGFYPGYGETWPSLQGSIGVLFEQASSRGLRYRRRDGSILTYADAVAHQAVAGLAVVRHAAARRLRYLSFFYEMRQHSGNGSEEYEEKQIFLLPGEDPGRLVALGRLLADQGVEVERVSQRIRNLNVKERLRGPSRKEDIPEGALLVRLDQPAGRLARSLLVDELPLDAEFLEQQRRRYERRERAEIFDITAWSLPFCYGVPVRYATGNGWRGTGQTEFSITPVRHNLDAHLAYLIPNGSQTGAVAATLLNQGVRLSFTTKIIRQDERTFAPGTLVVRVNGNPADVKTRVLGACDRHQADLVGIDQSWFDEGPGLGSRAVKWLKAPRIGLLWDQPVQQLSAGWLRYYLERELGYAATILRVGSLGDVDLTEFDVLLMPSAGAHAWKRRLGPTETRRLVRWTRNGGVLVAVGASAEWLMHESVGLLASAVEMKGGVVDSGDAVAHPKVLEDEPAEMVLPRREQPEKVYGALMMAEFDTHHWLAFGVRERQPVMVSSSRVLRPLRLDQGRNVGRFVAGEQLGVSGYVPEDTLRQFAHKPFALVQSAGRGQVIAFTENPFYRGFTKGLAPLLFNACFLGPAHTEK
ncbi:M14 family metallopeptidase [Sulfidibacter corallicola]|uniref:Peptidase M14 domain-containing protein n=1 Tax=Sulfidibacter corallicola TaxID=2818388 RepID=A0A8A4TUG2_SULCO|nr:M14 family metallopeptidase [Sulfidibacter corallicola]QTD52774.1 hypothetical protein J3U87_09885 [Sulfidibacter corallicola]